MARSNTGPDTLPPRDRVDLFVGSIERYESYSTAFPIPESFEFPSTLDESKYWLRVTHGMFLRKYASNDDQLFAPKVLRAMRACIDTSDADVADTWTALGRAFRKWPNVPGSQIVIDGVPQSSTQVVLDDLYSTLLHGNFARWQRLRNRNPLADFAMFDWVGTVRLGMLQLHEYWKFAVIDGKVIDPKPAR